MPVIGAFHSASVSIVDLLQRGKKSVIIARSLLEQACFRARQLRSR